MYTYLGGGYFLRRKRALDYLYARRINIVGHNCSLAFDYFSRNYGETRDEIIENTAADVSRVYLMEMPVVFANACEHGLLDISGTLPAS